MPQMIFGAPVGSEESRSVFEGYGMEMPSDAVQNAAFQLLGLGVMREFASQAGSAETVTRIERSIASVGEIIRSGGADLNTPVIDNIYSTAENVRISDPAAYETRSAAEFYGERVHRSDYRQTEQNWENPNFLLERTLPSLNLLTCSIYVIENFPSIHCNFFTNNLT